MFRAETWMAGAAGLAIILGMATMQNQIRDVTTPGLAAMISAGIADQHGYGINDATATLPDAAAPHILKRSAATTISYKVPSEN